MKIIRKYPNRRLYDTSTSQYVNLEHIRQLVLAHENFKVADSKTGEDLTKSVLLQIITDQETSEEQAILTNTVLKQLIRFYGSNMQGFLKQYIEQSLATFIDRQESLQHMMKGWVNPKESIDAIKEMATSQISAWAKLISNEHEDNDRNK